MEEKRLKYTDKIRDLVVGWYRHTAEGMRLEKVYMICFRHDDNDDNDDNIMINDTMDLCTTCA